MKIRISIFLVCLTLPFCTSHQSLDIRVKQFMKDSIVPRFNDPSSYEFISMQVDTFMGRDYCHNLRTLYSDTILFTKEQIAEKQMEVDNLEKRPGYLDSVLNLEINLSYRGKNKLGALVVEKTVLRYFPKEDKLIEVRRE